VKRLRTIAAFALAVFWLPVSVHCQLEELPGLEFLSCCAHEDAAAPHEDDDCAADACAVVESGLYKTEERQVSPPAPELMPSAFQFSPLAGTPVGSEIQIRSPGAAPPELPRIWQFSLRTAAPPRAPSPAS